MKLLRNFLYVPLATLLFLPSLAMADECELISKLTDSTGSFCCKSGGVIERVCSTHTQESCDYKGSPGKISHCDLHISSPSEILKRLPEHFDSITHAGDLNSPANCHGVGIGAAEVHSSHSPIDYSVNLMWINKTLNPKQKYLYPAKDEKDLQDNFLSHITQWAAATKGEGSINLWYDGNLTPTSAVENTKHILERETSVHPEWAKIQFRDIREFPEVKENAEVFSEKTPIYFRVDLLRVLAAYHTLAPGKKRYFVYGDLDMKPLSKDALFDKKTQKNLDDFGIVMARGGLSFGLQAFENGFQIVSNQKPNLMKAMKEAVIDISIARAQNILNGGYWAYKAPGDTQPLEQTVYDSHKDMFRYFYQLEGWGDAEIKVSGPVKQFGIREIAHHSFTPTSPHIKVDKVKFGKYDGKEIRDHKVKIPTKIVEMPPSHFGISPIVKYDPDKISKKNYSQKLADGLEKPNQFDNALLYVAARNNYVKEVTLIADKLSPVKLAEAFTTKNTKFDRRDELTPLDAAVEEGHSEVVRIVTDKLSGHPELLAQVGEALAKTHGYNKETSLHKAATAGHAEVIQVLARQFSNNPKVLSLIGQELVNMKKIDMELLQSIIQKVPNLVSDKTSDGETLALKSAKNGQMQFLRIAAEKAPQTLEQKDESGNFPLLLAVKDADFETFEILWKASKKMLTEGNKRGETAAHKAAEYGRMDIIQLIDKEAPELLQLQESNNQQTPADLAANRNNLDVLKFFVDRYPDSLKLRDRHGWTSAATVANSGNSAGLEYLVDRHPEIVLADISNVIERAAIWTPESLVFLAKKFPKHLSQITSVAKRRDRVPKSVIDELEQLATQH